MNRDELFIRLSMLKGHKRQKIQKLADDNVDINAICVEQLLSDLGFNQQQQIAFKQLDSNKINSVLNWLEEPNHHLITYIDSRYPPLLKAIHSAPILLFVKGNVNLLSSPQLAMVGSRQFSDYGGQWSRYFASELALNGLTITSGLALGIDGLCHRGALDVQGKTIAVLGSGLRQITPRSHSGLAQDIINGNGAIITEFFPDDAARPEYFPRRNRIISGLSLATFVVEASHKSGSLITANYAIEQNRDVFALPGDIGNENFHGTHQLIQQGAYLVTRPADILQHLNQSSLYYFTANHHNASHHKLSQSQSSNIDFTQKNFPHPEIFAMIHYHPISIDVIAQTLSIPIADLTIKLLDLELMGAIKVVNGGYIRCNINHG
jgi:DNA processing protein